MPKQLTANTPACLCISQEKTHSHTKKKSYYDTHTQINGMVFRNNSKDNFIESAAAQGPMFLNSRNNCKEMYQYNIYMHKF